MEILLAIAVSFVLQGIKWLTAKLGKEVTKNVIVLLLFAASLGFVLVTEKNWVSAEAVEAYVGFVLVAIGFYEGLIERLGPFLFGKAKLVKAKILKR